MLLDAEFVRFAHLTSHNFTSFYLTSPRVPLAHLTLPRFYALHYALPHLALPYLNPPRFSPRLTSPPPHLARTFFQSVVQERLQNM